jgi:hypothetical protein
VDSVHAAARAGAARDVWPVMAFVRGLRVCICGSVSGGWGLVPVWRGRHVGDGGCSEWEKLGGACRPAGPKLGVHAKGH